MKPEATVNAYLRSKVMSATPEQLRLMLIDGAIRFCNQGIDGLERKDFEQMYNGFTSCRNILLELSSSVRADVNAELARRVSGLYTFMYLHLVDAGFEKDVAKARKVAELLEFERETWVMLMEKLASERAGSTAAGEDRATGSEPATLGPDHVSPVAPQTNVARPTLSIQG